jgi:mannan endo-1,4-beta-mannosidase
MFLLTNCQTEQKDYPEPVNPNTTEKTQMLLKTLYETEGEYILSGHHNYIHNPKKFTEEVKDITGHYPVVWGSDFSFHFENEDSDATRQKMINTAKEMYQKGHIITLMWHACRPIDNEPCGWSESVQNDVSEEEWQDLVTPGTEIHLHWLSQVDRIARYLKKLEKENIPVLWRPYHEMNGGWFWWGKKKGEKGFVKLWKMMYNRLVNHHNINNLIWVWNANAPNYADDYKTYFPGHDYVDVLAADVYHNDYKQSHHDTLVDLAKEKPVALGEVGKLPTPKHIHEQSQWAWFMGWANWLHKENTKDSVRMLYNDPKVVTLNEITRNEDGSYTIQTE